MKTIIAGSRSITDYSVVCKAISMSEIEITEVVSGHATKTNVNGVWLPSVDQLGERWSREFLKKEPTLFHADWNEYGKYAGLRRNEQMGDYADALVAVWDGESKGTAYMIKYAKTKGLKVFVYLVRPPTLYRLF